MKIDGRRIKAARKAKRLTLQKVAEYFGISKTAVILWEKDGQIADDKFPGLVRLFGGSQEWFKYGTGLAPEDIDERLLNHQDNLPEPNAKIGGTFPIMGHKIPLYGQAVAGEFGEFPLNGNVLEMIEGLPMLIKSKDAYAVQVSGDSMSPRYEDRETVFVDPSIEPRPGYYVVAQIQKEENGPIFCYIKKLVKVTTTTLILAQLNPETILEFPYETVVAIHTIVLGG